MFSNFFVGSLKTLVMHHEIRNFAIFFDNPALIQEMKTPGKNMKIVMGVPFGEICPCV